MITISYNVCFDEFFDKIETSELRLLNLICWRSNTFVYFPGKFRHYIQAPNWSRSSNFTHRNQSTSQSPQIHSSNSCSAFFPSTGPGTQIHTFSHNMCSSSRDMCSPSYVTFIRNASQSIARLLNLSQVERVQCSPAARAWCTLPLALSFFRLASHASLNFSCMHIVWSQASCRLPPSDVEVIPTNLFRNGYMIYAFPLTIVFVCWCGFG